MQTERVIEHIVNWLRDYCGKSGLTGFVIGVSGGIDSALSSTLCARTGLPVLALNMPIYQAPDQFSRSVEHIAWLEKNYPNVRGIQVELTPPFQALERTLPKDIQDGLTMANTRSRLRMVTLYAFAGHNRMLVAGTGNRVEDFGVGFFTKYGDGGVDISPIADLMKSEVYAAASALGVVQSILVAAPTDGLWHEDRTDESQLGASYDELEWAMTWLEAGNEDESKLTPRQIEVLTSYRKFRRANRHKMLPIPICAIPDELRK